MNAAIIILVFTLAAVIGTRHVGRAAGWDRPPCSEHDEAASRERIRRIVRREVATAKRAHEWWNNN